MDISSLSDRFLFWICIKGQNKVNLNFIDLLIVSTRGLNKVSSCVSGLFSGIELHDHTAGSFHLMDLN